MTPHEDDWLSSQAARSADWLRGLPSEVLSPTGLALLLAVGIARGQDGAPGVGTEEPAVLRAVASGGLRNTRTSSNVVQPPLMNDVD